MASIVKLPSGNWRAQLRHRQKSVSKTFRLKSQAARWATEQQDRVHRGETPTTRDSVKTDTIGELIKTHLDDMAEVGKAAQRSKEAACSVSKMTGMSARCVSPTSPASA